MFRTHSFLYVFYSWQLQQGRKWIHTSWHRVHGMMFISYCLPRNAMIHFYCLGFCSLIRFKSLLSVSNFARNIRPMHLIPPSKIIAPTPSPPHKRKKKRATTAINLLCRAFPIVCLKGFNEKSALWVTWESKSLNHRIIWLEATFKKSVQLCKKSTKKNKQKKGHGWVTAVVILTEEKGERRVPLGSHFQWETYQDLSETKWL